MVDPIHEVLRTLGRIEGRLDAIESRFDGIEKLFERVRRLEMWQSWLKGGWTALFGAYVYLLRRAPT